MRDALIDLLGEAIGKENVITDNRQAQRVIDEVNGRVRPERISNKEVNKRFNEELQQQIDGTLPKDHTYQLGLAGSVLQSAGVRALPIELRASRLTDKSMQENHPFELSDIKNLPNAIQEPIMVFDSANTAGRKVILTEIESKGNNFVVVLSAELKGNKLEVNRIRSLYPKDSVQGIVDWINAGNLLKYADKNKALEWIGKQQSNSADVTNTIKNLDVAAKVLQNFENPTINEQKNEKNLKEHRLVGGNSGYVGYSMSKRAEQAREEGRYPKTDFKKVYNISDKTLKALVSAGIIDDNEWHHTSTPIHEYTHLWAAALRKVNPKEWQNIVGLMKKQTYLWDKVKNDYPELKTDDEIADEVLAHYSGERGKKLLDEEYNKIRDNNRLNIFDKAKMLQAINNVREALRKFWKGVADLFNIHFTSAEEVADKVLSDLLEGVNPNEELKEQGLLQGQEKEKAREKLLATEPIEVTPNTIQAKDGKSAIKIAEEWAAKELNEPFIANTEVGEVDIDKRSIKDSLGHGYGQEKLDAITSLKDGFDKNNATYLGSLKDFKGKPIINYYFAYPINYGGEVEYVFCRARKDNNLNRLYVHEVFTIKDIQGNSLQTDAVAKKDELHGGTSLYKNIIADILNGKDTTNRETDKIKEQKVTERVVEKATDEALEEVKDPILKRAYKGVLKESTKDKWASFADDYHALRVMEDKVIEEMRKRDPKFRLHHSVYEQQIAAKAATQGQIFLFSQQTFKPLLDKVDKIKYQ